MMRSSLETLTMLLILLSSRLMPTLKEMSFKIYDDLLINLLIIMRYYKASVQNETMITVVAPVTVRSTLSDWDDRDNNPTSILGSCVCCLWRPWKWGWLEFRCRDCHWGSFPCRCDEKWCELVLLFFPLLTLARRRPSTWAPWKCLICRCDQLPNHFRFFPHQSKSDSHHL